MEHDRRLARRYGVADEPVEWKPGAGMSVRRRGWIRDVSVTGARLIVPAAEHIQVGGPLEVVVHGDAGFTALVRWKHEMGDWVQCGLEYIDTTRAYSDWGLGILAGADAARDNGFPEPELVR